jgi:hypothetical protein
MAVDVQKLLAAVARLEADDSAALIALQALRDENKTTAAQLADVSAKLATLQAGGDTAALQTAIDDIVARLTTTADSVESGIANNPAVTNLPPADAAPPTA